MPLCAQVHTRKQKRPPTVLPYHPPPAPGRSSLSLGPGIPVFLSHCSPSKLERRGVCWTRVLWFLTTAQQSSQLLNHLSSLTNTVLTWRFALSIKLAFWSILNDQLYIYSTVYPSLLDPEPCLSSFRCGIGDLKFIYVKAWITFWPLFSLLKNITLS